MRPYARRGAARGGEPGSHEGGTHRRGRLALAAVGLIALGWLYSVAGDELRGALPAWAGGAAGAETVEDRPTGPSGGAAQAGKTAGEFLTTPQARTGPTMGELRREDERSRVEEAVRDFAAAYDFEGTSADAYIAKIEPYVTDGYWSSPRGAQNLADIQEIEEGGETFSQDAELVGWEPVEIGAKEATGYATRSFAGSVGDEEGNYTIRHELRLVKEGGDWLVSYGGEPIEEGA